MVILVPLVIAVAWFGGALSEWICGRILLPEMGLTAPGYWTWFWVTFVILVATGVAELLKMGLED